MTLRTHLRTVAQAHEDQPFLWFSGQERTYGEALAFADAFAVSAKPGQSVLLVSDKSIQTYFTIFATIIGGGAYIPVNKNWNVSRIENIIRQVRPDLLACDAG